MNKIKSRVFYKTSNDFLLFFPNQFPYFQYFYPYNIYVHTRNTYVYIWFTIIRDPLRLLVSYFHFVSIVRLLSVFKGSKIKKGYFLWPNTFRYHTWQPHIFSTIHTPLLWNKNLFPPKRCLLHCNTVIYPF